MASIKGARTWHVITFNPNKVNPGEELYVDIPKLKSDRCLVPGNLHFDFKSSNSTSWFLNNLSKLMSDSLVIKFGCETAYDNSGESHLAAYRDMWRTKTERAQAVRYGIAERTSGSSLARLILVQIQAIHQKCPTVLCIQSTEQNRSCVYKIVDNHWL